ncbi:uncharacterized protein N7496_003099 [Penicillium cataractarum]|uniref:Helicase C-terminal domain-containing protein n=1 Tax=Penicillium cataractarum TaxID=2100454 RepID=A0A9W9SLB7_9EURO|nr:uncharacterized protein N7496_003099 [Penicillium cataractarum]KAJ5380671.1 hypothetical protein N7496_003099 [Penicillium cataractarum]
MAGNQRSENEPYRTSTISQAARELEIAQLLAGLANNDNQEAHNNGLPIPGDLRGRLNIWKDSDSACHRYHWEHVILDECQNVKCIRTPQHQSIAQLARNSLIGLTTTPMWNTIEDFFGYLSLLAGGLKEDKEDDVPSLPRPEGVTCDNLRDLYTAWSKVKVLPEDFDSIPYALLNPAMLARLAPGGQISPALGQAIFPFLLRASTMIRSLGDRIDGVNGQDIVMGAQIPPIRVMTNELRYSPSEQDYHDKHYRALVGLLENHSPRGEKEGEPESPISIETTSESNSDEDSDTGSDGKSDSSPNSESDSSSESESDREVIQTGEVMVDREYFEIFQRLCLLGFNPLLDDFLRIVGSHNTLSDAITRFISAPNHGFTLFWGVTCPSFSNPRPLDAFQQVKYLIAQSPRLVQLLRIMDMEGAFREPSESEAPKPRFLLLSHWPLVCWLVEMVLRRIGIRSVLITTASSPEERAAAVGEFTNPDSDCQVLNTTYNCGGTGLDLHRCCHIVILIEQAPNLNLETHAIGRIHRIRQTLPQRAYRLFQEHTINRYIAGNNISKMIPKLAAQYPDYLSEELDRRMAVKGNSGDDDDTRSRENKLSEICEDHIRDLLGVADDHPYFVELLNKNTLGIQVVNGQAVSNRVSQLARTTSDAPIPQPQRLP